MSTSPLPPDPYEALGLNRDCDVDAVKKAHRKLVLKHHPDRIKDPALVEHNQNEFTKVQQAYEILVDPARRRRYDNECKLAQLRRERMSESRPTTYTTKIYTTRPTPAPTNPVQRESKPDPRYAYEDREPDSPYVDSTSRSFDEPTPRGSSRKDPFEKRPSTSKPSGGKERPRGAWEREREKEKERPPMSMKTVFGIAGMASGLAQNAKTKNKEREKELHAKNAKARDKEERSARDNKNTYARQTAYVEDFSEGDESSGTESDTIVTTGRSGMRGPSPVSRARQNLTPELPRTRRTLSPMSEVRPSRHQSPRPTQRPTRGLSPGVVPKQTRQSSPRPETRPARQPSPRPEARPLRQPSPRPSARDMRDMRDQRSAYDDDSQDDDKYESHYRNAQDYVFTAQRKDPRPPISRQGSGVHDQYWHTESGRDRKSGSDSDKQRSSSSQKPSRRSMPDESKLRPSLFPQSSAPAGVRGMTGAESRDPFAAPRSRGNSYVSASNNHRREMPPELKRSPSEPVPQKLQAKRDGVTMKGSSLKQTESMQNGDSGYGSSNPQTPENRGESPHRESREGREGRPREGSSTTKYPIRKDEDAPRVRKMGGEDGAPMSRFLSPQDQPHHHHHHHNPDSRERRGSRSREREVEGRHRSSSNRPAHPGRQPSFHRDESNSRYDDRDRSRNIRTERSPDRQNRSGADDGYFRSWPGPVKESRNKPAMFQGPTTPSYTKLYGEASASPRGVHQHRGQPSAYAVR